MRGAATNIKSWISNLPEDLEVADLRLDSRQVCANDLFFAVGGSDWTTHLLEAAHRGAAAVIVDSERAATQLEAPCRVIAVPQLRQQLGAIADAYYGQPSRACTVVGITGTNGKTTCSHWLAQAWQALSGNAGVIGTLGCGLITEVDKQQTGLTTPDVFSNHRLLADMLEKNVQMVAMEVSSHALDQGRVDGVQFDTAIFTNLTRDHLDYHGDMQSYAAAKQKLFDVASLKHAIVNSDDDYGKELLVHLRKRGTPVLAYALDDKAADLGVERYEVTGQGIDASVRTPWGRGALQSRYPGGYNLLNVLAVVATLCGHGMSLQSVFGVVTQLQAVSGRTQIISSHADDILVVVDYAHTPDALQKILQALREQAKQQLWCVFGCGGNRDRGKRPQMAAVAAANADAIVVTTDNPRDENPLDIIADITAGLSQAACQVIEDRAAAIAHAVHHASTGDVVLLAGKGHENYQEVKGKRLPFSDIEQARQALAIRRQHAAGAVA